MTAKRERYTPNDVGPSPLEWDAPLLKDISTLITNGFVGTATPFYTDNHGITYLYGTNVRENHIDLTNVRYITKEFHIQESKTELREGDLLTVQSGHIGTTAVVTKEVDGANCHALIVTRLKQEKVNPNFLCYYINSHIGRARMRGLEVGSTIFHINTKDLKKFRVLLPPLPEQQKIAQILSNWDKAIEKLEALIAAKQKRKKALMQQLLTGKKRFAEFVKSESFLKTKFGSIPTDWQYLHIAEVAKQFSVKNNDGNDLPVLSCTKHYGLVDSLSYFGKQIFSEDTSTYKVVLRNSFAYATNHIEEGSIGYQNLYDKALISPMYTVFQTNENINDEFLFRLLKTELYRHIFEVNTSASVDRRGSLRWNQFSAIKIPVPTIPEQQKIASFFAVTDTEIETYQKQLAALKEQKKGLMQQLLTGKKRVHIEMEV
jgi:type I restriction enzyme S subunit